MKKKLFMLSELGLSIVFLFTWWSISKDVHIGYVELSKEVENFKLSPLRFSDYIEDAESLNNVLHKIYENPSSEDISKISSSKMFKKYNKEFFNENFLYLLSTGQLYTVYISDNPLIKVQDSYVTNGKLRIEVEITSIGMSPYSLYKPVRPINPDSLIDPHGYILEIPRKEFDMHNMEYDDIEIAYLNANDYSHNVQVGKNKGKYDPNYPMPKEADTENAPKEPKLFFPLLEDE